MPFSKIWKPTLSLVFFLILLISCSTTKSAQQADVQTGKSRIFDSNFSIVLETTQLVLIDLGMDVKEAQAVNGSCMLVAEKPPSAFSWGEIVRILVEDMGNGKRTTVRVITKRKNITAKGDWSPEIFAGIEERLGRR